MARRVSVDPGKIRRATLTRFKQDEDQYGINWDLAGGGSGSDLIGTKEEAEAELTRIRRGRGLLPPLPRKIVPGVHDSEV